MKKQKVFKLLSIALVMCAFLSTNGLAQQTDINGPAGSGSFGRRVVVLPNGNIAVADPTYSIPMGAANVGAVYLYNGSTGNLISTLTGSTAGDFTSVQFLVLSNGNYLIRFPNWDNGAEVQAGAVTFANSTNGVAGVVSATNSLVGSTANNFVGGGVTALTNGNYVVSTPAWNNGAGAVTFGNGTSGVSGVVSAANSLVGSTAGDLVGTGITELTNGNYLVGTPAWNNGGTPNVGAVTFGNGTTGITGVVSAANSLVGGSADDQVGADQSPNSAPLVTALPNGNYVIASPLWDNGMVTDAGAVTWGNGTTGTSGLVSATNSLVGGTMDDRVGGLLPGGFGDGVTALPNGNYVVVSAAWDNGTIVDAGAVTFGNGSSGVAGVVSATNSLVGSTANDRLGNDPFSSGFLPVLSDGDYVVVSPSWDNGTIVDAGAVTFGNGTAGVSGVVSATNSLVGGTANDQVGLANFFGVTELSNGNYVVSSSNWNNGPATDAGAVTWGNGTTGVSGVVSDTNSLVGGATDDQVGFVTALTNGNYVVASPGWDGTAANVGAVTWGNGSTGISGTVSAANSLVGSTADDGVGGTVVAPLSNGNYVVASRLWDNGGIADAGAVTFGSGTTGISGVVSAANSLVGSTADDQVGSCCGGSSIEIVALTNGNYLVSSPGWDNGGIVNAGAVTFGNGTGGTSGVVTAANSLVGSTAEDGLGGAIVGRLIPLPNGNYVSANPQWDNGGVVDAGAVTFGNGNTGTTGMVSPSNSLVGTAANDQVGAPFGGFGGGVTVLSNGNYVVRSDNWDNGGIVDAGAISMINGVTGSLAPFSSVRRNNFSEKKEHTSIPDNLGPVTMFNSVLGTTAGGGLFMNFAFDATNDRLVVGRSADNIVTIFGRLAPGNARADFDGDARTDISIFRPSEGNWYLNRSSGGFSVINWGIAGDTLVPGDYDGDGKADAAVFRPSDTPGVPDFYILNSNGSTVSGLEWGSTGDIPVVGDYDSDGKDDVSVWRESDTTWITRNSSNGTASVDLFGSAGDIPVVGDWDGDGKIRPGIFRPGDTTWYLARATGEPGMNFDAIPFGLSTDTLVPGDYDGDGKTDVAVWRPSDGTWYIQNSGNGTISSMPFGTSGDIPVPGDYDGDGKEDLAVYRNGDWWIDGSGSGGMSTSTFGLATDTPIPSKDNP